MLRYRIIQKYGDLYWFQVAPIILPIWFTISCRYKRQWAIEEFDSDIKNFKQSLRWRLSKQNILRWLLQKENVIHTGTNNV